MKQLQADVVVVGGGPAGSTAATLVAKAGPLKVIQLEKERHPRHQIGESLLPATVHGICRMLDIFGELEEAGPVVKRGGTFQWGRSGKVWTFAFNSPVLGDRNYSYQVERAWFDALLFENARKHGVECYEDVTALGPIIDNHRIVGVTARGADGQQIDVYAKWVIDASGHKSQIARHIGRREYSEFFRSVAVYGYFNGAGRFDAPYEGNVIASAFPGGWCWFIPLSSDLTSVGAVVEREHASRISADPEAALIGFTRKCPLVSDLLHGARRVTKGMYGEVRTRRDWSYVTDKFSAPGFMGVGDAVCFVDPVFSSGVHLATYGGMLAARTAATVLSGALPEEVCLLEFERRYRREFSVWYDFLLAFFDMQRDWEDDPDGYFWQARRVLNTRERANDAFINLVAGAGTAPDEFFAARGEIGRELGQMVDAIADFGDGPPILSEPPATMRLLQECVGEGERLVRPGLGTAPLFPDGLIPTDDGLRWAYPVPAAGPAEIMR